MPCRGVWGALRGQALVATPRVPIQSTPVRLSGCGPAVLSFHEAMRATFSPLGIMGPTVERNVDN
jgi:hypothetical protein